MSRASKYGIRELRRDFPTNKACLGFIFDAHHSRRCGCGGVFSLRKGRSSFRCGRCRKEVAPQKGTIFEKTKTPLTLWFHALMMFSNAKSGLSAKELERNLAITYKCAWRMLSVIRSSLRQGLERLSGVVEADLAYLGGRKRSGKAHKHQSEAILSKPLAMGAIERGGRVRAQTVAGTGGISTRSFILSHVEPGSSLFTDKHGSFKALRDIYRMRYVNHSKKEYARGTVHVNTVESFWSHVKRSTRGTFKSVSKEHLQSYLDAFAFHYNNAGRDRQRFETLLQLVLLSGARTRTVVSSSD
jgi:hypothetical protein